MSVGSGALAPTIIGVEYVVLNSPRVVADQARAFSEGGFKAAKPIAEAFAWGEMQTSASQPVDFTLLDSYVEEFQARGFVDSVLALKSHSAWASKDHGLLASRNAAPKTEYEELYSDWVTAVVERYDADGVDDMPGLVHPIRYYEIGSEFSSYEPEPVSDYLRMLELAYSSAHAAYADVIIAHAAFLVTDKLFGVTDYSTLGDGRLSDRYGPHSFTEMRAILDRPELFDVLNVHALGHPGEIDQMLDWLQWETDRRGYSKRVVISDTSINPFIAFGPAIDCSRNPRLMGLTFYPATEADRCRLAEYFNRVLDGDPGTLAWARAYAASDMVKKVVIAAERDVALINTAFTTDLPILDSRLGQAGAGNAGWGGMIDLTSGARHPNFYAMQQLIGHIDGYLEVERLDVDGPAGVRVYRFNTRAGPLIVGWYDPPRLLLPEDGPEVAMVTVPLDTGSVDVESMISDPGQRTPLIRRIQVIDGAVRIELGQLPVYVLAGT